VLHDRQAELADIPRLQVIRAAVRENILSNPALVTVPDYEEHIRGPGRSWVCEEDGVILGFSSAHPGGRSIWALFVDPAHERRGIGRALLDHAVAWLWTFSEIDAVQLTTAVGTRADNFYRAAGWSDTGRSRSGEVIFRLPRPGR
jgi:GNAT superfamily N-acetyltransferase